MDAESSTKTTIIYSQEFIATEMSISREFVELTEASLHALSPPSAKLHRSVNNILFGSAFFSLAFFPVGKSDQALERSELLKQTFNVDSQTFLNNRTLRNHIAHLDERMDRWLINSENKTFGRGMIGSRAMAQARGLRTEDILGLFDPATFIYSFCEDDIHIDDLVGEVRTYAHRARKLLRETQWPAGDPNV